MPVILPSNCRRWVRISSEETLNQFSLETLVNFNNGLSDYVREVKPDARVMTHVHPA